MKVVNLFAGPCAGKSTTAMGLSYKMKLAGKNVEYVTEYAKSLTWEKRDRVLENQLYILAKQDKKLRDLDGQVDWAVSDSPLIIGIDYMTPEEHAGLTEAMYLERWAKYDNINFFIVRDKPYNPIGRHGTLEDAKKLDGAIFKTLKDKEIPFILVKGNHQAADTIYDILFP